MKTLTRDDTIHGVEYVTKHEAQLEIDDANHRGMIAAATLRNEITSIKQELKHHLDVFEWMDGPEGWADSCQRLNALLNALPNGAHDVLRVSALFEPCGMCSRRLKRQFASFSKTTNARTM